MRGMEMMMREWVDGERGGRWNWWWLGDEGCEVTAGWWKTRLVWCVSEKQTYYIGIDHPATGLGLMGGVVELPQVTFPRPLRIINPSEVSKEEIPSILIVLQNRETVQLLSIDHQHCEVYKNISCTCPGVHSRGKMLGIGLKSPTQIHTGEGKKLERLFDIKITASAKRQCLLPSLKTQGQFHISKNTPPASANVDCIYYWRLPLSSLFIWGV